MFNNSPLRLLALAAVLSLAIAVPAAANTKVNVRVEGAKATLFDGKVTATPGSLRANIGSDRAAHLCNAAFNKGYGSAAATPTRALLAASEAPLGDRLLPLGLEWFGSLNDFMLASAGAEKPSGAMYWDYWVNWKGYNQDPDMGGGCHFALKPGDQVVWAVTDGSMPLLRLSAAKTVRAGASLTAHVANAHTGAAVAGALVGGARTNAAGNVKLKLRRAGSKRLVASKRGAIRSNAVRVRIR